ncbi:MAG: hypothetical protein WCA81_14645 [Rhizomicrobium sp.]
MSKNVIFYTVVVGIPALVIAYFFLNVETLVVVHNTGASDTMVSMVIAGGGTYERTPDKPLKADSATLIMFTPQTTGELFVTCMKDGHWKGFSVGHASPNGFLALDLHIESCERLASHRSFAF